VDNSYVYPTDPIIKLDLRGMLSADAAEKWKLNGQKIDNLQGTYKPKSVARYSLAVQSANFWNGTSSVGGLFSFISAAKCEHVNTVATVCNSAERFMPAGSAVTIGSVVVTPMSASEYFGSPGLAQHEEQHARDYALFGPGFITLWAAGGGASCSNPWEEDAGYTRGYQHCNWGGGGSHHVFQ